MPRSMGARDRRRVPCRRTRPRAGRCPARGTRPAVRTPRRSSHERVGHDEQPDRGERDHRRGQQHPAPPDRVGEPAGGQLEANTTSPCIGAARPSSLRASPRPSGSSTKTGNSRPVGSPAQAGDEQEPQQGGPGRQDVDRGRGARFLASQGQLPAHRHHVGEPHDPLGVRRSVGGRRRGSAARPPRPRPHRERLLGVSTSRTSSQPAAPTQALLPLLLLGQPRLEQRATASGGSRVARLTVAWWASGLPRKSAGDQSVIGVHRAPPPLPPRAAVDVLLDQADVGELAEVVGGHPARLVRSRRRGRSRWRGRRSGAARAGASAPGGRAPPAPARRRGWNVSAMLTVPLQR